MRSHRMFITLVLSLFILSAAGGATPLWSRDHRQTDHDALLKRIGELHTEMDQMHRHYAARIEQLRSELARLQESGEKSSLPAATSQTEFAPKASAGKESLYDTLKRHVHEPLEHTALKGLELDASVVVDTYYYRDDTSKGMGDLQGEISGFGHAHGAGEAHGHDPVRNGFNLRHVELGLSARVDPYFKARTTIAAGSSSAEVEEAVLQTTSLPCGFTLSGGRFFSDIGRINRQHSHDWDFLDAPLVYERMFGPHRLRDTGVQVTWQAPAPFHLLLGAEAFDGENEKMFQSVSAAALPSRKGPRLWTGFVKFGPSLGGRHVLQAGLSYGTGNHQEAHDGNADGTNDAWLDGKTGFWGVDLLYRYPGKGVHGHGDWILQGEYFCRRKDLTVERNDLVPALTGRWRTDRQDGYYLQALYGFAPRWRGGVRWEQIGLINDVKLPDLSEASYGASSRATAMIDWRLSEHSLLRLQGARGLLRTDTGNERTWEFGLQWQVLFGQHGEHRF